MSQPKIRPAVPPILLPPREAAAALGMGETAFREHVAIEIRCVRRGSMRLYPVRDLERWADKEADRVFD
jgi:hypothetical protein